MADAVPYTTLAELEAGIKALGLLSWNREVADLRDRIMLALGCQRAPSVGGSE